MLAGLTNPDDSVAAGCAEVLRQQRDLHPDIEQEISRLLASRPDATWPAWLAGQLPTTEMKSAVAAIQEGHPRLHYAISVLWAFAESWIARDWEAFPNPTSDVHP